MCQSKNNSGHNAAPSPCAACAKCKAKGSGNCAAKKLARNLAREQKSGQIDTAQGSTEPKSGQ